MILTAKYVFPITSDYFVDGAVCVRDNKIVDLGPSDEITKKYPSEELRDYGLAAIMPGFIDLNTDLSHAVLRGTFDDMNYASVKRELLHREPFFTQSDWEDSARLGVLEAVASGITCIVNITNTGACATAAAEIGLRARFYYEACTAHKDHVDACIQQAAKRIDELSAKTNPELVSYGLAAGPVYMCHPQMYTSIASFAREHKVPVAIKIAGSQEEADFIRYGSSPFSIHASMKTEEFFPPWLPSGTTPLRYVHNWRLFEAADVLAIHCIHIDDDDVHILHDYDVAVCFCPRVSAKLGMGITPVLKLLNADIRVGLGTSSPCAVDTTDMIDEMRVGSMILRALAGSAKLRRVSADKMLRMATIDAAAALRMDDKIGSLEPGKLADIIAVDLHNSHQNPTNNPQSAVIYTANQDNVKMTMVGGRILYDNFVHVSGVDRNGIVDKARSLSERLRRDFANDKLRKEKLRQVSEEQRERYTR